MRGRFNALEVSERDLKTFTAFAMWLTTAVAIIGFSFIPAFAPDDVATWRIALGGPVALLIVLHVVLPSRLSDGALYLGSMISTGLSAIAILALVHATPATMAVLSNCFTAVLFGAYFLERRHMLVLMSMITAVALSTIATNHSLLQPHIDAWLAVFIPTLWVIALTISVQREDLRRALRDSKRKAYTDPLTGLANLRGLRKYAESLMTPEKNGQIRAAGVLLIDLHDFKDANTKYGHLGGDQALRTVAEHLRRAATGDSFVARIGGDEFAVVLRNVTAERLHEYAGLFRGAVLGARAGMKLPGIAIDACVGTAMFPYEGQTLDDLLTVAAKSMYAEKNRRGPTNSVDSDSAEAAEAVGTVERLRWGSADESMTETRGWLRNSKLVHRYLRLPGYAKFAAVAWFAGSASILLSLAITDADHTHETVVLVGGIAGVGTSLLSFWVLPKAGSLHHIFVDGFCLVTVGGAIYLTGGSDSAALPLIYLLVVYQSLFLGVRAIKFRLFGPLVVLASPLFYEGIGSGSLAAVTYVTLGSHLLVAGMVTLVMSSAQSQLDSARRRSQRLAATDPLTSLPNRRAFQSTVEDRLTAISSRNAGKMAIVMIDLDNFKDVNTLQGHAAGDALLSEIAQTLAHATRAEDFIARIGGDEFAVVLTGSDCDEAETAAVRFTDAVDEYTASQTTRASARVSASAGVAVFPDDGRSLDALMFSADRALMAAKTESKRPRPPRRLFASA